MLRYVEVVYFRLGQHSYRNIRIKIFRKNIRHLFHGTFFLLFFCWSSKVRQVGHISTTIVDENFKDVLSLIRLLPEFAKGSFFFSIFNVINTFKCCLHRFIYCFLSFQVVKVDFSSESFLRFWRSRDEIKDEIQHA